MADNKKTGPDLGALAAGAAVGAIAGAAAVMLSDPKKRSQVSKKIQEVQVEGKKTLDSFKQEAMKIQGKVSKQVQSQIEARSKDAANLKSKVESKKG